MKRDVVKAAFSVVLDHPEAYMDVPAFLSPTKKWERSPYPATFVGWAYSGEYEGTGSIRWGCAFKLEKDCFGDSPDRLFFDCDDWRELDPAEKKDRTLMHKLAVNIEQYSSGITNVRFDRVNERTYAFFDLDSKAVKPAVLVPDKEWEKPEERSTAPLGGYVFILPWGGEFTASFGILQGGKEHCFYKRGFCMK